MKLSRITKLMVVVLLCLAFIGCNRTESKLIGKWKNISLPETVEFKSDKSGTFEVKNNPSLSFGWKILDEGRVEIDVNYMGNIQKLYGKLEKDTFVLEGKGEQAVYKKSSD